MKMITPNRIWHRKEPLVSPLIFNANFTAASKNSATFSKSSSTNPLDVRAGVPEAPKKRMTLVLKYFGNNQQMIED